MFAYLLLKVSRERGNIPVIKDVVIKSEKWPTMIDEPKSMSWVVVKEESGADYGEAKRKLSAWAEGQPAFTGISFGS